MGLSGLSMWNTVASVAPMPLAPADRIKWHSTSIGFLKIAGAGALEYCVGRCWWGCRL